MSPENTFGPSTILTFAGVELDTICCESRLREDKSLKCKQLIAEFIKKKKATLRELHSLTGVLNFACSVVVPGRCFLRWLIDLTIGLKRPGHFVRVFKEVKADLFTWQKFFQEYNDKSFFLNEKWENSVSLQLYLLTQEGRTVLELYLVLTGAMVNGLRNGWVKILQFWNFTQLF